MGLKERRVETNVENDAVFYVKGVVEATLMTTFGQSPSTQPFAGKLSTNPYKSTATADMLKGKCGIISSELQAKLEEASIVVDRYRGSNWHRYLIATYKGVHVYIDASIGQYVKGHNHTFVGTKAQLEQLVLRSTIINTNHASNARVFYQNTWGHFSQLDQKSSLSI